jgi:hypothetical protein
MSFGNSYRLRTPSTEGQRGAIGLALSGPVAISLLTISATSSGAASSPYVTLEVGSGASGCAHEISAGMVDPNVPVFCWGAFSPSATERINVRVDSSGPGAAELEVLAVAVN